MSPPLPPSPLCLVHFSLVPEGLQGVYQAFEKKSCYVRGKVLILCQMCPTQIRISTYLHQTDTTKARKANFTVEKTEAWDDVTYEK